MNDLFNNKATPQLIDMLLNKLGDPEFNPVSDRRLGKLLGVSHTQIARFKRGNEVMSRRVFTVAARLLNLPGADISEFQMRLDAEEAADEATRDWFEERCRAFERSMDELRKSAGKAAAILGAAILTALLMHSTPVQASTYAPVSDAVHAGDLYIMRST